MFHPVQSHTYNALLNAMSDPSLHTRAEPCSPSCNISTQHLQYLVLVLRYYYHSLLGIPHHYSEGLLSIFQLLDPVVEEVPQTPCRERLGSNSLDFDIQHGIDDEGREDVLKTIDNMSFNYLGSNVGDECLLQFLYVG